MIVGAGFAGFNAARELSRVAGASTEIMVINSTGYFLYLPLLPQVGAGLVEPRHICVSLLSRMPRVRFVLGTVTHVDVQQKFVTWSGRSVASALDGSWVQLSTGEKVATHSLIWCVGVRADPLVTGLDRIRTGGGSWLMSSCPCPAPRTFTPAGTAPRCPT